MSWTGPAGGGAAADEEGVPPEPEKEQVLTSSAKGTDAGADTFVLRHVYINYNNPEDLPRQARDRHGKS